MPCKNTAIAEALCGSIPLDTKEAVIPAKTSPLPAVARPGLPVILILCFPSKPVTIVWLPFKIKDTSNFSEIRIENYNKIILELNRKSL